MSYLIVGTVCLFIGSIVGAVTNSLMVAASMEDRCRECLDIDDLK